jgi:hypothetical protein
MSKYNPLEVVPELRAKLKVKARIYQNVLAFITSSPMHVLLGAPEDFQSQLTPAQEKRVEEAVQGVQAEITRLANRGLKSQTEAAETSA